jgi:hypothetical protein
MTRPPSSPTIRHALKKARTAVNGDAIEANVLPDSNDADADAQKVAPGTPKGTPKGKKSI